MTGMLDFVRPGPLLALCVALLAGGHAAAQGVFVPPDANIVNITAPPYNAVGDGVTDNTAAFQRAIEDNVDRWRIIYIPDGVYLLRDKLQWGRGQGGGFPFGHALRFQGQSQAGTILRLAPNSPGFQFNYDDNCDGVANDPKVFIDLYMTAWDRNSPLPYRDCNTGNTANAFGNEIHDLTIEIGAGNPGATALQYQSNNTGSIRNLTVRAMTPTTGYNGVDMGLNFPGPLLIKGLTVEGFDTGVVGAPQEYSVTIQNLTTRNQRTQGVYVWRLPLQIQNWTSENSVPALVSDSNPGGWGSVVVDTATFTGVGAAATTSAVVNRTSAGSMLLRNITTTGYASAVTDLSSTTPVVVPGGFVAQHVTDAPYSLFNTSTTTIGLPQFDAAIPALPPLTDWANVVSFGATPNSTVDNTAAIQAAMNSGKSVIYFPSGSYNISDTITLGPAVRRIIGYKAFVATWSGLWMKQAPMFRVPTDQPLVVIEGLNTGGIYGYGSSYTIEQVGPNTLVLRDGACAGFRNATGGGTTIFENIVGENFVFDAQRVYARQLNPEGKGVKVINRGGDVSLLGLKTEGLGAMVSTEAGGRTEVLGGLQYPSTRVIDRTEATFLVDNASMSASMPESSYICDAPTGFHDVWVRETRSGDTRQLLNSAMVRGHSNCGLQMNLYNTVYADSTAPSTPAGLAATSASLSSISLAWQPSTDAQSGVARYEILRGGVVIGATRATTFTDSGLPDGVSRSYQVRAYNGAGLVSGLTGAVSASTAADTLRPRLLSARGDTPTQITAVFSEPMATGPATTASNYSIPGLSVLAAALSTDGLEVTLTTSAMTAGAEYVLTASGLTDRATAPNALLTPAVARYTFAATGSGTGLLASYYPTINLTGTPIVRVDPVIDFNYGLGGPPGLPPTFPVDGFSVRWVGQIVPRFTETYTISTISDDGSRVLIDGRSVVSNWRDQAPTERFGTISLVAGRRYDIVVEFYENSFGASVQMFWQSPSQPRQIIPASQLIPQPLLTVVRTADGRGADTNLSKDNSTVDQGAGQTYGPYFDPFDFFFDRAGLVRFDIASLGLRERRITDAVLAFTLTGFGSGDGVRTMQIFGLKQSANADNWIETGPGFASWANTPGMTLTADHADPAFWTYLGQIVVNNAGFQQNFALDALALKSQALNDWLATDTDGLVTVLVKRATPSTEGTVLAAKEFDRQYAAALKVSASPPRGRGLTGVIAEDIGAVLRGFATQDPQSDINHDGRVDFRDLMLLLSGRPARSSEPVPGAN